MTHNRTPVDSSNIVSVGYDPEAKRLSVEFKGGAVYHHDECSPEDHSAFMAAESKGKHYHANIKGKFKHTKAD